MSLPTLPTVVRSLHRPAARAAARAVAAAAALDSPHPIIKFWPIVASAITVVLAIWSGAAAVDNHFAADDARRAVTVPMLDAEHVDVETLKDRAARTETAVGEIEKREDRMEGKIDILLERGTTTVTDRIVP